AEDWAAPAEAASAFRLDAGAVQGSSFEHRRSLLVMMNGERESVAFALPGAAMGKMWSIAIDTREAARVGETARAGGVEELEAGSLVAWVEVTLRPESP
ncbi:MAG: hypothetical protein M3O46_21515, partial [Myxococcota bacterium]|nr:hypothetical protein [Myxococcota bacterium]